MRPSSTLRPPVVVLPLPELTVMRPTVVLARRPFAVRAVFVSRVFAPAVVRVLRAVHRAVVRAPRRLSAAARKVVLTVEAARPPPAAEAA